MPLMMRIGLVIGTVWLLSGGAAAEAREVGFVLSPHVMAPHFAGAAPLRIDRSIGSRHLEHPEVRSDRRIFRTKRSFANPFGAPVWSFWPDLWPDEVAPPTTPEAPEYGRSADTDSTSERSQELPAGASDLGSTVIRRDYPGYTLFDHCRVPARNLNDCGPEWIVMHPIAAAPVIPPSGRAK